MMNRRIKKWAVGVSLVICIPSIAVAHGPKGCKHDMLKGQYVFTATGFSRADVNAPWFPKAIVEYMDVKGDGTLSVPAATIANRTNDGAVVQQPPGAVGAYSVNDDCTGTLQFTNGPSFNIFVAPRGDEFWMIQTNPNNVLQGNVKRLW
jgi:hypothetical protein